MRTYEIDVVSSSAFLITQTNPTAGRFVPPGDVRGWDRYAYVENNPLRYADPSGHDICDEQGNCYERGNVKYRKINGQEGGIDGLLFTFNYHKSDVSDFIGSMTMWAVGSMPISHSGPMIRGRTDVKGVPIIGSFQAEPNRVLVPNYHSLSSSGPSTIFDAIGLAEVLGPFMTIPVEDDTIFSFTPHYISDTFDLLSPVRMRIKEMYVETHSSSLRVTSIKVSTGFTEQLVPVQNTRLTADRREYFDTSFLPDYNKNTSLAIHLTAVCVLCVQTGQGPADRYITFTLNYPREEP